MKLTDCSENGSPFACKERDRVIGAPDLGCIPYDSSESLLPWEKLRCCSIYEEFLIRSFLKSKFNR